MRAQNGGVLVRAGHTEAAVDIAKLAGLNPSGVICEIMKDDGQMARLPDLIKFGKKHNLKIATIADLIEYRRKHEKLIEAVETRDFVSQHGGKFKMTIYKSKTDDIEHIALTKGEISARSPTLVRMHHLNIFADCLFDASIEKKDLLKKSMKKIDKHGTGAIIIIRQPQESLQDLLSAQNKTTKTLRNYGIGAQILSDLGIKQMTLLTTSKKSVVGIDGYGLEIIGYKKL